MPATCTLTEAPAEPAVTLAAAKAHLRVGHAIEDELIGRLVRGAAADATAHCGLGAGVGRYLATFDRFPSVGPLALPVRPLVAVVQVRWADAAGVLQVVPAGDYRVGLWSARLAPRGAWPVVSGWADAVEIEFTAGLSAAQCPPQLVDAILLVVGDRYAHRGDGDDRRAVPAAAERLLWQLHTGEVV